jgi:hypothetical protein
MKKHAILNIPYSKHTEVQNTAVTISTSGFQVSEYLKHTLSLHILYYPQFLGI